MPPPLYPLPGSPTFTRRSFVAGSASFAVAAWLSSCRTAGIRGSTPAFSAYPFSLGVASGDPGPTSVVLWTRLAPQPLMPGGGMPAVPVRVAWQVADDEAMTRVVRSGTAMANPQWGHSVHAVAEGLRPDRWYWYQFRVGGEASPTGRTRTFPPVDTLPARLRFAFASCQNYENGLFTALDYLAREDVDFIVHLGDYIYEMGAREKQVRRHNSGELFTLEEYRARYIQYKLDPALQSAHASAPWIVTWDDHEVANNYARDIPATPVPRADFLRRRAAAYQAYYEMLPLRPSAQPHGPDMLLYRRLQYGRLAQFHVLDTRQYRTDQPCGDGTRAPCEEMLKPNATLLGTQQRDWLFRGLDRSPAPWNVLAQQIMMARVDRAAGPDVTISMDQWPGYEIERRRVLKHFRDRRIKNPVVLTGDIHSNWANELITDFDQLDGQSVGVEFVGTSITSGGDGSATPRNLEATLAENPFVKFHNTERGYVRCEVTPQRWTTDYRTVPYVSRPGAPINTRATFVVESGRPKLNAADHRPAPSRPCPPSCVRFVVPIGTTKRTAPSETSAFWLNPMSVSRAFLCSDRNKETHGAGGGGAV
ncbi:MAG: alkaline phosphatase D family protein [Opitutaceae bacterium]|nr:alkaline phosphatase D family protein [Opitutaceae bacterium]